LEPELFGHKRGAFTGAIEDRAGCFETASGGTLFLDEIGEMSLSSQVKFLRVLQEKQITRVGDSLPRNVDVRIIAASNKNLADMVKSGQFREDLYYRLRVVGLVVPSLLDRKDDIPDLVAHFIAQFNEKYNKQIEGCSPKAMDLFLAHSWPGNIRELEHAVEHAFVVTAPGQKVITANSLPPEILHLEETTIVHKQTITKDIDEKTQIINVLAEVDGNKSQAARILGITRAGLYKKMHRLEL
jgi:transcriptional regulator with PAS, ATPase and Fis domain